MDRAFTEARVPISDQECSICRQLASVMCQQCGQQVLFCIECTELEHTSHNIFHRPQVWKVRLTYNYIDIIYIVYNTHSG